MHDGPDPLKLTERQWQTTLTEALERLGYLVNHVFPMKTKRGYRTGTTVKGWPDLEASGKGHILYIEVKGPKTVITAEQVDVLLHLSKAECARCWILRPKDDWQMISNWIARPADSPKTYGIPEPKKYLTRGQITR